MNRGYFLFFSLVYGLFSGPVGAAEFSADQIDFFEKKIRPVLAEKCYSCHSATGEKLKAHLQVDHREHLLSGGDTGASIVPGDPEKSLLIEVISYETPDLQMPPKGPLEPKVVDDFRQWIADGAPWPDETVPRRSGGKKKEEFNLQQRFNEHWSWRPVEKPAPPNVGDPLLSELDRFIASRIKKADLLPAKTANKRTLIRRAYFDLIGLPPSPEQIAAFLQDDTAEAWANLVDGLLSSPHFGEKWARHWLDLVRYAETYGHEFDYPIDYAYEYRDYLIRALNADVPYDQFVIEHIAGDLLENPRRHPDERFNESILGTGFWYFHEATHAPTDVLQDEADHMDNQLDVFGKSFLGLTVACARCHDHKFDAISTADYYALTSYLHSSCRQEYPLDPGRVRENTAKQLRELQQKGEAEFKLISKEHITTASPGKYFLAAAGMMKTRIQNPITGGDPWSGIVFDDFESGTYSKWKVSGTAFGKAPATGNFASQKITGDFGKGLANSYFGSDKHRGSLTSQPFTIEKPFLNFYIAGGKSKELSFEIHIDRKMYLSSRGKNSDVLEASSWNLSTLIGKTATLKIKDDARGSWGHINVDQIVFSDHPAVATESPSVPDAKTIKSVASQNGLDSDILTTWTHQFVTGETDTRKPKPFFLKQLTDEKIISQIRENQNRITEQQQEFEKSTTPLADFSENLPDGWSTSGLAFQKPSKNVALRFDPARPFAPPGVYSSNPLGNRQNGTLRSPTFEIGSEKIHVLARSNNLFARVVMDNYHMAKFSGLLFAGTIEKKFSSDGQFTWFSFQRNLDKYIGHKAFLEFVDKDGATVEIAEIRLGNASPPAPIHPVVLAAVGESGKVAANLDQMWAESWQALQSGTADIQQAEFLNWLVENELISIGDLSNDLAKILADGYKLQKNLPQERYAVAMAEGSPEISNVYIRGSHRNLGETVSMRNLTALGGKRGNRLELATQIATAENPLTSRVMVNRIWHHLFGRGIVPSVDDFGPMGQMPSHPDLLDWLAADFVENGWSVKSLIRKIMLSRTYRQDSLPHPDLDRSLIASVDPENILLHRMPVRRLPAEAIRDAVLTVS
ncbi:MAG: PSD1 and planctomycete cytochrome C domain-containing protein, partial [Verrucomicrobiales bacterium]|nr:PSD1 and planctomycete cytochrome C domain-containing protein [Verrucomicrobiales bacterium]